MRAASHIFTACVANSRLSSDVQLPSSPPKRTETQSARRRLMKRPSIYDPRMPSSRKQVQPDEMVALPREQPDRGPLPSLSGKLPVEACATGRGSSKRKRVEDESAHRVTHPRLSIEIAASRQLIVPAAKDNRNVQETIVAQDMPLTLSEESPAQLSPTRKTYGKYKPAANPILEQAAPQAGQVRPEQPELPTADPAASAAEAAKLRKAASKPKPKPKPKPVPEQGQSSNAASSSPKKAPAIVKREAKGPRQPARACKSCHSRHQKCDRTHPTCERCTKLGISCDYPNTSSTTQNAGPTSSPGKKQAQLPAKKSSEEADRASVRERSVTISSAAPRQKGPRKGIMPPSPSKKLAVTAAPTAASSRAPRANNARTSGASSKR